VDIFTEFRKSSDFSALGLSFLFNEISGDKHPILFLFDVSTLPNPNIYLVMKFEDKSIVSVKMVLFQRSVSNLNSL
jgi:hypothetical protein